VYTTVTAEKAKYIKQGFDQMNNSAVFGLIIVVIVLYFAMGLRNSVITSLVDTAVPAADLHVFQSLRHVQQRHGPLRAGACASA
jgi:multidrug efflux pump subunit AcrB